MIPCTEFIPAYSELFTFLEKKRGRAEVDRYWKWLFDPENDSVPLDGYLQREGIKGFFSNYAISLSEEAADFTNFCSEKGGWYKGVMHYCPSKGRLLELQKKVPTFVPYHDYCLHCDNYRLSAEKAGFGYIFDFEGMDEARCVEFAYDPAKFDGRVIVDEDTLILDRRASDNEYFHRQFHASLSNSLNYLGENYGTDAIVEFLTMYMKDVFPYVLAACADVGLKAIADFEKLMYAEEKASDLLTAELSEDGKKLTVKVSKCPAREYLKSNNLVISEYFGYADTVPLKVLAESAGAVFTVISYDDETGAAEYGFVMK